MQPKTDLERSGKANCVTAHYLLPSPPENRFRITIHLTPKRQQLFPTPSKTNTTSFKNYSQNEIANCQIIAK